MIVGNYRIGRVLARGGMATVYRGVYRPTGMPVAIKVLSEESARDEVLVYRMHQEARIQNMLGRQHPGIVTCYEPLVVKDRPAMVLEFVPGRAIADILDEEVEVVEALVAIDIAIQALDALAYAHHHGVVHRDIKSENIMVTPEGRVKIADFGVARAEVGSKNSRVTESRDLVGTMVYMAPEQLTSPRTVDHRADLYSLGVTLYEMLTGEVPFDGDEGYPLMKRIEQELPADPRTLREDLPECLVETVMRSLHKEPDERYYSAGEMEAALRRCRVAIRRELAHEDDLPDPGRARGGDPRGFEPTEPSPLPEPRAFGYLEDLSGRLVPGRILLRRAGLKIGRHPGRCDIIIPDDAVAPEHALILPLEIGEVLLIDLLSPSGITVDERRITRHVLRNDEVFTLAQRWPFRFRVTMRG
ncbi:serine/threonine protein kinase [Lujinxingia litoralis]|uniref:serine/threonine protein kinase n=1 Tax=Lujinxingia litoralis TaxID=2211119 RepID=UPI0013144856|nr:FHA domain-containing serine/threonine-protein kinase [Lujinxingia litoralis]